MNRTVQSADISRLIQVGIGPVFLEGNLDIPPEAVGIILFAHGSGSSRHSPRNFAVAHTLRRGGLGTLLIDLLTAQEEVLDEHTAHLRFDIELLTKRLIAATDWLSQDRDTAGLPIGYFGASTGAAAALLAASLQPDRIRAVVSRGGRPDLAGDALASVRSPTLLLVGGKDVLVIELNHKAFARIGVTEKQMVIIPGATHLFSEAGALDEVGRHAEKWFIDYLTRADRNDVQGN